MADITPLGASRSGARRYAELDPSVPHRLAAGLRELQRLTGVGLGTIRTSIARGGLTITVADRLAIGLGQHPAALWPSWYEVVAADDALNEASRQARWRAARLDDDAKARLADVVGRGVASDARRRTA